MAAAADGEAGFVTSMICTASSATPDASAYTLSCTYMISISCTPLRATNPSVLSNTAATADGAAGFVTFTICMPSSDMPAASAYTMPCMCMTAMPRTPPSASNSPTPSRTDATADGEAGFVMFMISMPSSAEPAIRA